MFSTPSRYDLDLLAAVAIPIAAAPFGYLLGSLFITHLVSSDTRAVWISTVLLTSVALLAYSVLHASDT